MSIYLFTNNAQTTLAAPINAGDTTCVLATGTGSLFPNPAAGQQFTVTFNDATTALIKEICLCTARSADILTIVRAQEGTTALAWATGDLASNYLTAGTATAFAQTTNNSPTVTYVTSAFYTQTALDTTLIIDTAFAVELTLLNAASYYSRVLTIKNTTGFAITSATANIVPTGSFVAGTAILESIVGTSCILQSDGVNWVIVSSSVQSSGF